MARREVQPFNLSLLDLLTSALGAVIFLFIITPKGGTSPTVTKQVTAYLDTAQHQVFGLLPDSLHGRQIGDTLRIVLVDYRDFPKAEPKPEEEPRPVAVGQRPTPAPPPARPEPREPEKKPGAGAPEPAAPAPPQPQEKTPPVYRGDAPSVPCLVSFEISWKDAADNVDLFVCKDGACVYGGRKRDNAIGQWDSGKSRNRLFGNDLRTNQEAVRQFDKIQPGEYLLYAQFKNSERESGSVSLNGLIYTKSPNGHERGTNFSKTLILTKDRALLGKVVLREDGNFSFIKN